MCSACGKQTHSIYIPCTKCQNLTFWHKNLSQTEAKANKQHKSRIHNKHHRQPPTAFVIYAMKLQACKTGEANFGKPEGEQSHYSNHPRAHTVNLGRMTMQKIPPTPGHAPKPSLISLIRSLRPHCSQNPLMLPFDTQVCHECQICLRFNRILKVILEIAFQHIAQRFEGLIEFLWSLLAKLDENAFDAAIWSSNTWWHTTVGGKLCSGAWKCGQDSHIGMFSLLMMCSQE